MLTVEQKNLPWLHISKMTCFSAKWFNFVWETLPIIIGDVSECLSGWSFVPFKTHLQVRTLSIWCLLSVFSQLGQCGTLFKLETSAVRDTLVCRETTAAQVGILALSSAHIRLRKSWHDICEWFLIYTVSATCVGVRLERPPVSVQCSEQFTCCAALRPAKALWDCVAICCDERPLWSNGMPQCYGLIHWYPAGAQIRG